MRRAKGQGYLFKKSKYWYLRLDINGKRKAISLKTTDRNEAEKLSKTYLPVINAETREELAAHVAIAKRLKNENKSLPISEAWEHFINHPGKPEWNKSTLAGYKRAWELFTESVNVEFIGEVDNEQANLFARQFWDNKVSSSTYNHYIGHLKLMFNLLRDLAGLESNPFDGIARKKKETAKHQRLSDEQFKNIISVFDNPQEHKCYIKNINEVKTMIFLGAFTGLRLKDCALMKMKSINYDNLTIQVKTHKTGANVLLPISPALMKQLQPYRDNKNEYLLPTLADRYIKDRSAVSATVARVFIAAGLETINVASPDKRQRQRNSNQYGFHSLRHTFISWCARAGVPLSIVQSIVGHFSQEMTQYYIQITDEERRQILNALPDI
jgi:integrase